MNEPDKFPEDGWPDKPIPLWEDLLLRLAALGFILFFAMVALAFIGGIAYVVFNFFRRLFS